MLDKRGVGLSDRVNEPPTLQDRIDDTLAVIDAEGVDRVHLVGHSEGGPIAVAIAALHPERVESVVLIGAPAQGAPHDVLSAMASEDERFPTPDERAELFRSLVRNWGSETSVNLDVFAPSVARDPRIQRWYQRFERQSASPGAVLGFFRSMRDVDITGLLPQVHARTLVVHSSGDRIVPVTNGRYFAASIPGAQYLELPSDDHIWELDPCWRSIHDVLIEFVTGRRPAPERRGEFAAVLFTDLVDSTAREVAMGDEAWRRLLDVHDRIAAEVVGAHDGRVVKSTGDGLLATFPDPSDAVPAAVRLSAELDGVGLPIRCGIHAGRVEVREDGDVSGITVNLAARIQGLASAGEVLVSRTIRDLLLGADHVFNDRGEWELKGIEGTWRVYDVESRG